MSQIILENVSVEFPIFHASSRSLKKTILNATTGGLIGQNSRDQNIVSSLKNISFALNKGDRLALVGHNGAGKTTLLRVLAGIYHPTQGTISIEGKVTPMFDISTGIDSEATGYENIITRGLFLGLSRKDIERKMDEIAEFADLGNFLHMPMHTYSSGMNIRLAFAVSTSFYPEILLLDEWLSAGDANFIQKANKRVEEIVTKSSIMVLASHSMDMLKSWCNKALWLEHGQAKAFGETEEIVEQYLQSS